MASLARSGKTKTKSGPKIVTAAVAGRSGHPIGKKQPKGKKISLRTASQEAAKKSAERKARAAEKAAVRRQKKGDKDRAGDLNLSKKPKAEKKKKKKKKKKKQESGKVHVRFFFSC